MSEPGFDPLGVSDRREPQAVVRSFVRAGVHLSPVRRRVHRHEHGSDASSDRGGRIGAARRHGRVPTHGRPGSSRRVVPVAIILPIVGARSLTSAQNPLSALSRRWPRRYGRDACRVHPVDNLTKVDILTINFPESDAADLTP